MAQNHPTNNFFNLPFGAVTDKNPNVDIFAWHFVNIMLHIVDR